MRPWTDKERGLLFEDLSAAEIAALTGRSKESVYAQRSFLKHGGGNGYSDIWTEAEDALVRELAGRATTRDIASKLPGRTPSAVKQRRMKLGLIQPAGINPSPFLPAERVVIAKTCTHCGLIQSGAAFPRNQGGGRYLSSHCRHCLSAQQAKRVKSTSNTSVPAGHCQRDWRRRIQAETVKHATRSRYPYLDADIEILQDETLTILGKALRLKRTYRGVAGACQAMGFKSNGHLLRNKIDGAWSIDNPNADHIDEITAALKQEFAAAGVKFPEWDWDDDDQDQGEVK